jgi:DNA-binding MarR family transcriptional regulator
MSDSSSINLELSEEVRETCLCLHAQRAARALARRFDEALRPAGLTNEQFSLLMSLNRPDPASVQDVASLLGADRTTLTAALKLLVRRGLAEVGVDRADARVRRVALTAAGHARLISALSLWRREHEALEAELEGPTPARLRHDLNALSAPHSRPASSK